ncbi:hypothetical protein WN48_01554 [Eufriesea mexicana]|nr:hypothetical protein WN48_01554 [Eufriesea mexicana]
MQALTSGASLKAEVRHPFLTIHALPCEKVLQQLGSVRSKKSQKSKSQHTREEVDRERVKSPNWIIQFEDYGIFSNHQLRPLNIHEPWLVVNLYTSYTGLFTYL